jgi:hypothetical protein
VVVAAHAQRRHITDVMREENSEFPLARQGTRRFGISSLVRHLDDNTAREDGTQKGILWGV